MKKEGTSLRVRNERSNLLVKLRDCFSAIAMTIFLALMPIFTFISAPLNASASDVEMADVLHQNGKIYVVVGVIAIIFVGIVVYLITIDRRLTKIEKGEQ